jgi:hypothetical protein
MTLETFPTTTTRRLADTMLEWSRELPDELTAAETLVTDFSRLLAQPTTVRFARETARLIHVLAAKTVLKRDLQTVLQGLPEIVVYGLPFQLSETRAPLTVGIVGHEANRIYNHYEMLLSWTKNFIEAIGSGQRENGRTPITVRALVELGDADIRRTDGYRFITFPEIPKDDYYYYQLALRDSEGPAPD